MARMNQSMQVELKKLQDLTQKGKTLMAPRAKYMGQQQETIMVKKELEVLDDDAVLYKLVGPVLIKQEVMESKMNVDSRLKYFTEELARIDAATKENQEQQEKQKEKIMALQELARKAGIGTQSRN